MPRSIVRAVRAVRPVRLGALVAALLATITTTAIADAQSVDRLRFGLGAGASLERGGSPGLAVLGSVEVSRIGSPLGVRGELLFTQLSHDQLYPSYVDATIYYPHPYPYGPWYSFRERRIGALLGGTYEFRAASAVRPFLLGGAGAYYTRRRTSIPEVYFPDASCPPEILCVAGAPIVAGFRVTEDDANVGLHAGIGTTFDAGRVQIVAQARYHLLDGDYRAGRLIPLTIGLRF